MRRYQRFGLLAYLIGSILLPATLYTTATKVNGRALMQKLAAHKGLLSTAAAFSIGGFIGHKLMLTERGQRYGRVVYKTTECLNKKKLALWGTGAATCYGLGRLASLPKTGKFFATVIAGYGLGSTFYEANAKRNRLEEVARAIPKTTFDELFVDKALADHLRTIKSVCSLGFGQAVLLTGNASDDDKHRVIEALAHDSKVPFVAAETVEADVLAETIFKARSLAEDSPEKFVIVLIVAGPQGLAKNVLDFIKRRISGQEKSTVLLCVTGKQKDSTMETTVATYNFTVEIKAPDAARRGKFMEKRLSQLATYEHKNAPEELKKQAAVLVQKTVGVGLEALSEFFNTMQKATTVVTNKELDAQVPVIKEIGRGDPITTTIKDVVGGVPKELEDFIDQMQHPEAYTKLIAVDGVEAEKMRPVSSGLLLYGPPGTGKSLIARAIAGTLNIPFVEFKSNEVRGELQGQTEKFTARKIAEARTKAGDSAESKGLPRSEGMCIVFMDEVDGVAKKRSPGGQAYEGPDILQVLLSEIDGGVAKKEGRVFLIATTNRKDRIDPGMLRSGRLETHIEIGYPSEKACNDLLVHYLNKVVHNKQIITPAVLDNLAKRAYAAQASGADMERLVMIAFRNSGKKREDMVTLPMLLEAADTVLNQIAGERAAQERADEAKRNS